MKTMKNSYAQALQQDFAHLQVSSLYSEFSRAQLLSQACLTAVPMVA